MVKQPSSFLQSKQTLSGQQSAEQDSKTFKKEQSNDNIQNFASYQSS